MNKFRLTLPIKRKGIALLLMGFLIMGLTGCGNVENEYSRAECSLLFDNSIHNDAVLAGAMTQYSGVFVTVTTKISNGNSYFVFSSNQGTTSNVIFNALDKKRSVVLGMNGGLIVGYGSSIDGTLYAFDRECPNCFSPDALPLRSHPLSVNENGFATCSSCHRTYNLNNGGIVSSGDAGSKLTRYHASSTGPYGVLNVY